MKRGAPPRRRTPLRRSSKPIQRKPIRRHVRRVESRGARGDREHQADVWFARYIVERDRECRACGKAWGLDCAHIVKRRYRAVRWDERNAIALCRWCHDDFEQHPKTFIAWLRLWYAVRRLGILFTYARTARPQDPVEAAAVWRTAALRARRDPAWLAERRETRGWHPSYSVPGTS